MIENPRSLLLINIEHSLSLFASIDHLNPYSFLFWAQANIMKKTTLLILYLIPVSLVIWFVAAFSVNVPFRDQWALVPIFDKVTAGTLTFRPLWALHSNHRIPFPKIIMTVLAFISHWNINYEIYFSIFLSLITFGIIYKISETTAKGVSDRLFQLTNIYTCFLFFSLVQYENWLWGFQLSWFLINLCVVSAVYLLNKKGQIPAGKKMFLAGISCFIASFSSAHGLLSWLAVIPSLFALEGTLKNKIQRLLGWMSIWVALVGIYTINYHPKNATYKIDSFGEQPVLPFYYFFCLIGAPIVRYPMLSAIIGLIIFSCFIGIIVCVIKVINTSQLKLVLITELTPWLSIGLFSMLCSLAITIGRVRYGVEQALESRYTTTSLLLIIACIQSLCIIYI